MEWMDENIVVISARDFLLASVYKLDVIKVCLKKLDK